MGITQIMEMLKAFEEAANTYAAVMADGKISLGDISKLVDFFPVIQSAVSGAEQIPAELKDLDPAEAGAVYAQLVAVYAAWKAAV